MGEAEEGKEIRDLSPHALDGQEYTPRDQSQVDLLPPPESARLLRDDLEGILVDWRVCQPADPVDCKFGGIRMEDICQVGSAVPREIVEDTGGSN